MNEIDQTELRREAEARADAKLKLYGDAVRYVVLSGFLLAINWWQAGRISWAIWPVLGLGLALGLQAAQLQTRASRLRDRLVQRELDALRGKAG